MTATDQLLMSALAAALLLSSITLALWAVFAMMFCMFNISSGHYVRAFYWACGVFIAVTIFLFIIARCIR